MQIICWVIIILSLISAIASAIFSIMKSSMKAEYITLLSVDIMVVAVWNIIHTGTMFIMAILLLSIIALTLGIWILTKK